jgi:hypothetical protein
LIDNGRHRPRAGILAATVNDGRDHEYAIYVRNTAGGVFAVLHGPDSAGGTMLAFSPDGSTFAVGDEKASTFIWNVNGLR